MRASQYYLVTLKEAPQEAELPSHKLMLRAGVIRKLGMMPCGTREHPIFGELLVFERRR